MSTFPSTRLKIKSGDGWFAADRSGQSAAQKLSDGAFKLLVGLPLAGRRTEHGTLCLSSRRPGEGSEQVPSLPRQVPERTPRETAVPDLWERQPTCHRDPSDPRRLLAL